MAIDGWSLQVEEESFREEFASLEMEATTKLLLLLETVGWETVLYLRSHTSETRPPVRAGEPARRAHPGGWADVSGQLANGYRFELYVDGTKVVWSTEGENPSIQGSSRGHSGGRVSLLFLNGVDYAAELEAMDGYFVLRGVTEPGGPVRRALRSVVSDVPGWELR